MSFIANTTETVGTSFSGGGKKKKRKTIRPPFNSHAIKRGLNNGKGNVQVVRTSSRHDIDAALLKMRVGKLHPVSRHLAPRGYCRAHVQIKRA